MYIGVSPSLFDEMVADGRMPGQKLVNSRTIWDRWALDRAFETLPDRDGRTHGTRLRRDRREGHASALPLAGRGCRPVRHHPYLRPRTRSTQSQNSCAFRQRGIPRRIYRRSERSRVSTAAGKGGKAGILRVAVPSVLR